MPLRPAYAAFVALCLQLTGGQLVAINAKLVKKQRFHFTTLQGLDVDIIAGLNGLIWVSPHVQRLEDGTPAHQQQQQAQSQQQQQAGGGAAEPVDSAAAVAAAAAAAQGPSREQREAVVRVAGAIRALAALMLQVYPGSIIEAYQVGWCC
jgi:exosome complex component RRP4